MAMMGRSKNKVGHSGALTLAAYYNGVNQIANDIAKLPKSVMKKVGKSREPISDHPVQFLINREASNIIDSFTFHFIMTLAAIHRGNGIALRISDPNTGKTLALEFLHPDKLRDIRRIENQLFYYTDLGVFPQADVIHIMGFTDNGYIGKSVIQYAAETLGIAKSAQAFTSSTFENRGVGFGYVTTEKEVKAPQKKIMEDSINNKLMGDTPVRTVMLDEGMEYKSISLNMAEAELIEQNKFSVIEIARFLNISPRKLKDYSINNYASAYQDATDHVNDTITPWIKKWTQEYNRKLFTAQEKAADLYTHFSDSVLLRGDMTTKANYYSKLIFSGVVNRNEVRAWEDLNSGGPDLDEYLTPVNLQTEEQIKNKIEND
tara:strand:+ start:4373 stop:5497 length:1125 start_codon:yes stop_codon:yes gene_type:complete